MTIINRVALAATLALALAPLAAHAQTVTYSGGTGGDIPNNNAAGISSTINVADNFVLTDFNAITITGFAHGSVGDLVVTLSHGGKTVDIFDRVVGNGSATSGDTSDLFGDYTFVSTGGADFNAEAARRDSNSLISPDLNYATVPVGSTTANGGVSDANGLLSDFVGLNVNGAWTLNISDRNGSIAGSFGGWRFTASDRTQINTNTTISDGAFSDIPALRIGNNASTNVTLAAGATVQNATAFNGSRLFMNGGRANTLRAEDTARIYLNAGLVSRSITATESSIVYINGGDIGTLVRIGLVAATDNSTVFMNGGSTDLIELSGNANAYILAGTFGSVSASGNSDIFIYGGGSSGANNSAVFGAYGGASISLFGDNLALDFASRMAGMDGAGNLGTFYNLSGTLTDGTSLLGTRFFDADGGFSVVGENPGALFFNGVAVVPEAGTLPMVLSAGCLVLGTEIVRRKRKGARLR